MHQGWATGSARVAFAIWVVGGWIGLGCSRVSGPERSPARVERAPLSTSQGQQPVAVISGGPFAGAAPLAVYLDATTSYTQDPNGWIAAFSWNLGDGSTSSAGYFTHTYAAPGNYAVTLTVTDGTGVTSTTTQEIAVGSGGTSGGSTSGTTGGTTGSSAIHLVISANPGFTSATAPFAVELDASQSTTTDPSDWITGFTWQLSDGAHSTASWIDDTLQTAGTYTGTLTATDAQGHTASQTFTLQVGSSSGSSGGTSGGGGGQGAVARITGGPFSGEAPLGVYLDATTSSTTDPNGWIASFSWDLGDGTHSNAAYLTHTYATPGTYTVTLTATDGTGAKATATQVVQAMTTAQECAVLMPASLGKPVNVSLPGPCHGPAVGDGRGVVALPDICGNGPVSECHYVYDLDGGPQRSGWFGVNDEAGETVWGLESGFFAELIAGIDDDCSLAKLYPDGGYQALAGVHVGFDGYWVDAHDASGAAAALDVVDGGAGTWVTTLKEFDANLKSTAQEVVANQNLRGAGIAIDLAGHTLVLLSPMVGGQPQGDMIARWFDRQGNALTSPFDTHFSEGSVISLLDGSVLLYGSNGPLAEFPDAQAGTTPVPGWLQGRKLSNLTIIRGTAGYALLPPSSSCNGVEVLTASGESCGCIPVPNLSSNSSIGLDGTLLVPHYDTQSQSCMYDWYPHVL